MNKMDLAAGAAALAITSPLPPKGRQGGRKRNTPAMQKGQTGRRQQRPARRGRRRHGRARSSLQRDEQPQSHDHGKS